MLNHGFIAQDIKSIIPHGTKTLDEFIPSIYELAFVSGRSVYLHTKTTETITLQYKDDQGNSYGYLKIYQKGEIERNVKVVRIIDDTHLIIDSDVDAFDVDPSFNLLTKEYDTVKETSIYRQNWNNEIYTGEVKQCIFVYGPMVNDFLTLNNDTINTIVTAATQEIDVQLQSALQRITRLEEIIQKLNK